MKMLEAYYKEITAKMHPDVLRDMLAMDVTPSAKWFLAENDQEHWDYTQDFPCLVPPSPLTWMEFEAPDRIQSEERIIVNSQLKRSGIMALTFEIKKDARVDALKEDILLRYMQALDGGSRQHIDWEGNLAERHTMIEAAIERGDQARWLTIWNIIIEPIGHDAIVTMGLYGMYLDEQGRCIAGLNACISALPMEILGQMPDGYDVFADALPFMFCLSLTHCKNVTMSDLPVAPAVARKRARKGIPSFTFKVLDIKPMRAAMRSRPNGGRSETKNAMHFTRGHFKEFSPEKPLFGKHAGRYWWGLSLRGNAENGVAQKEYRVQPA